MAETDLWFGTLTATVRVEDLPASRRVVAIELPADGQWRVCGAGTSNSSGVATLPITGLPTSRIYAVAIDDWGRPFVPGMTVVYGDVIRPTQFLGWMYQVTAPGVMPSTEPEWWNGMAGIPQPVGTAMMQAIRHYQPIAHGPVSDIEWEEMEYDPHWDNVVALLHFNGDLRDETGLTSSLPVGSPEYVDAVFGGGLRTSSDTNSYAMGASVGTWDFGDADFTVEGFIRLDAPHNSARGLISGGYRQPTNDRTWALYVVSGNSLRFIASRDGSTSSTLTDWVQLDTPAPLIVGMFYHVAVVRQGTTLNLFLNGSLEDAATFTHPIKPAVVPPVIGAFYPDDSQVSRATLDEVRITKGVCRYVEQFDPPTSPFPNVGPPL